MARAGRPVTPTWVCAARRRSARAYSSTGRGAGALAGSLRPRAREATVSTNSLHASRNADAQRLVSGPSWRMRPTPHRAEERTAVFTSRWPEPSTRTKAQALERRGPSEYARGSVPKAWLIQS